MSVRQLLRRIAASLAILLMLANAASGEDRVTVFAAASLTDAVTEIARSFEAKTGNAVSLSFAGSPTLARQIDAGAPVDLFVSADSAWMDWLVKRDRIVATTRIEIAGNRLVLAVRQETENWADPEKLIKTARVAIADPESVPAGRYAKEALEKLDWWQSRSPKTIYTENVRLTLAMLARGTVEAAIVYESDVLIEPRVRALYTFSTETHAPIIYPAAITKQSKNTAARAFLSFLSSPEAKAVFTKLGFPAKLR
ncbi:MAG: molybdate ABC transporter substrate-binding protein [Pseudomonadota bacterium]